MTIVDARLQTIPLFDIPEWHNKAACRGVPYLFFPQHGGDAAAQGRRAKAICATCPVLAECTEYVVTNPPDTTRHGIWAGMTEQDRKNLRRRTLRAKTVPPKPKAAPTPPGRKQRWFKPGACVICGKVFPRRTDRLTCSRACLSRWQFFLAQEQNRTPSDRACAECGVLFVSVGGTLTCSSKCRKGRIAGYKRASRERRKAGIPARAYRQKP